MTAAPTDPTDPTLFEWVEVLVPAIAAIASVAISAVSLWIARGATQLARNADRRETNAQERAADDARRAEIRELVAEITRWRDVRMTPERFAREPYVGDADVWPEVSTRLTISSAEGAVAARNALDELNKIRTASMGPLGRGAMLYFAKSFVADVCHLLASDVPALEKMAEEMPEKVRLRLHASAGEDARYGPRE